jgi:hypothetical protein
VQVLIEAEGVRCGLPTGGRARPERKRTAAGENVAQMLGIGCWE